MASYVKALTGDSLLSAYPMCRLELEPGRRSSHVVFTLGGAPTCPVGLPLTKHASVSYSLLPIDKRARLTKYLARVHRARC